MSTNSDDKSPSSATVDDHDLDAILAIQLAVASAGETVSGEARLGWWRTELTDPKGGGDFLARLLPRTHHWAALSAVREAARRVDEAARRRAGQPDDLWSLFHFGFAWDERLDGRLSELRRGDASPAVAFAEALPVKNPFDAAAFGSWLQALAREALREVVPGGRKLRSRPTSKVDGARRLAASLVPFAPTYPLPFFAMGAP